MASDRRKQSPVTGKVICAPYHSFTIHCKKMLGKQQWEYRYTYKTWKETAFQLKRLHLLGCYDFLIEINTFLFVKMDSRCL